jgi:shikimate kinase
VYLCAEPAALWERVHKSRNRPLLNTSDKRARLEQLFRDRDHLYREVADVLLESDREHIALFAQGLEASLREAHDNRIP